MIVSLHACLWLTSQFYAKQHSSQDSIFAKLFQMEGIETDNFYIFLFNGSLHAYVYPFIAQHTAFTFCLFIIYIHAQSRASLV